MTENKSAEAYRNREFWSTGIGAIVILAVYLAVLSSIMPKEA